MKFDQLVLSRNGIKEEAFTYRIQTDNKPPATPFHFPRRSPHSQVTKIRIRNAMTNRLGQEKRKVLRFPPFPSPP